MTTHFKCNIKILNNLLPLTFRWLKQTVFGNSNLVLCSFTMMPFKDRNLSPQQRGFLAIKIIFIGLSLASLVTHVQGKVSI